MEVRRRLRLRRLSILHSREAITGPGPGKAISASSQAARHSGDGLRGSLDSGTRLAVT